MAVQNVNKGFVYITDFTASLIYDGLIYVLPGIRHKYLCSLSSPV